MKKGWIFLLIFVLCIGVLVYGYADTMTEWKTHVNPAPQVGDEPGLARLRWKMRSENALIRTIMRGGILMARHSLSADRFFGRDASRISRACRKLCRRLFLPRSEYSYETLQNALQAANRT